MNEQVALPREGNRPEDTASKPPPVSFMSAVTRFKGVDIPGQRFEIDKLTTAITAGDLRTIMNLPYEVSLYEDKGRTVMSRGSKTDTYYPGATREARWMLHTHPFDSKNPMPSSNDVLATWRHDHKHTTHMLVTRNGILTYRAPQYNPARPTEAIEDIRLPLIRWGKNRGLNLLFGVNSEGEAPPEQLAEEMYQFMRASGMIIDEAGWDDQQGLDRVLSIINDNGRSTTAGEDQLALEAARRIIGTENPIRP